MCQVYNKKLLYLNDNSHFSRKLAGIWVNNENRCKPKLSKTNNTYSGNELKIQALQP